MAPERPYQTGTEFDGVTGGPLARTGARLSRNRVLGFQVGVPRGPSWHPVTEIAESAWLLDAWLTTRLFGLSGRETWGHVEAVVDRLAVRVSQVKARPRLFPVRWSGGEVFFVVRGTCCLKYQEFRARGGVPDRRGGAGFCATCPLRDDGGRAVERRAKLERMAR